MGFYFPDESKFPLSEISSYEQECNLTALRHVIENYRDTFMLLLDENEIRVVTAINECIWELEQALALYEDYSHLNEIRTYKRIMSVRSRISILLNSSTISMDAKSVFMIMMNDALFLEEFMFIPSWRFSLCKFYNS